MDNNEIKCKIYKKCSGCQLMNMDYEHQLKFKQKIVYDNLKMYGKINTIIPMDNPYHYRNKVQMGFKKINGKDISGGIYQSKKNSITPVKKCLLDNKKADEIIITVAQLAKSFKLKVYDFVRQDGFLRHVLVRCGNTSGEIMVVIVTSSIIFSCKQKFVNALVSRHPEITTIVLSVEDSSNGLVIGDRLETLYGKGYIEDTLCGLKFRISPKSFYQVNSVQTEILYKKAIELADIKEGNRILDAYCGTGTIGLLASVKKASVIGVELNENACNDAIFNAKMNNIENAEFINSDAGEFMKELVEQKEKVDVVFMDPPRQGSSKKFIDSLAQLSPAKVVYVSCNPVTLSRDLFYMSKKGYWVKEIQPVDMFPHTSHVECVVLMSKAEK